MKSSEIVLWSLAGVGVAVLLFMAQQQTGEPYVPSVQSDEDVMGLGLQASMRFNVGTPLECTNTNHGWHPGYDPDPSACKTVTTPHRYPAVPGGNLSTVMHQGWSRFNDGAPAGNDWRLNPPEAAVL